MVVEKSCFYELKKMAVYAITGKLGSGKSLVSVGRIFDYLRAGKPVATNLNLDLTKLFSERCKFKYTRLPDFPTVQDFTAIGKGTDSYDETKNGLIVLDECGVFFNSRDWQTPERQEVIKWLLHSRKLGWDVILIVQDVAIIDKQIRLALIEHVGICKRMDRMGVPFIGAAVGLLGFKLRLPRVHVCSVKYGLDLHALVVDRWFYRGSMIQNGYDTKQVFSNLTSPALHSVLSPWHVFGRYLPPTMMQQFKAWLSGASLPRFNPVPLKSKHPLVLRVMKLPDSRQRLEFIRRFEQCGAFA